jgi:hypothetical protein
MCICAHYTSLLSRNVRAQPSFPDTSNVAKYIKRLHTLVILAELQVSLLLTRTATGQHRSRYLPQRRYPYSHLSQIQVMRAHQLVMLYIFFIGIIFLTRKRSYTFRFISRWWLFAVSLPLVRNYFRVYHTFYHKLSKGKITKIISIAACRLQVLHSRRGLRVSLV